MSRELDDAYAELVREDARLSCHFYQFFPDADRVIDGLTIHARDRYPKHMRFFALGATYPQRLFMAANRVGKTEAGAFEVTCHLTGLYPEWWEGRRFDRPGEWWACGQNSETLRDIVQAKLFGPPSPDGVVQPGGMIPPHLVHHTTKRPHGLPNSVETAWIKHVSGGLSQIGLKTYEQGRQSFEGTAKQGIWDDEEPPEDIYTEQLYRTATTGGIVLVTFTPLQGLSKVVTGFIKPDGDAGKYKVYVQAGWDDVPHLAEDVKAALIATTPPYQRDARTKGTPQLGAGAIYAFPESELLVGPFEVPRHWKRWFGLDAGGGAKPTAVVWQCEDPATNTVFNYDCYKRESPEVAIHIAAIKDRGAWIPGVGDAAALIVTAHDAEQLIRVYQRGGLDLELPDKAVESGIQEVWQLMSIGKFKAARHLEAWLDEFRVYHRDEKGRIVKANDHLMDATRYGIHSGRKRGKSLAQYELETARARPSRPQHAPTPGGWMRG